MKFLIDFFPVIAFYIAYKMTQGEVDDVTSVIIATAVLMVATVIQVAITWFREHKIEKMHIIILLAALIFGSLTIISQDQDYLIWKVSITNWLFAAVFLGSHFIGKMPIVKRMMQNAIDLPDVIWTRLSYMWISFFVFLGIINLIVAYSLGLEFSDWVDFKLFGLLGLTFAFVVVQAIYLAKHMPKEVPVDEQTTESDTEKQE